MSDRLDDQYLDWLYAKVGLQEDNVHHAQLMSHLYSREFVMLVPNDDNRCADGLALRQEFMREKKMPYADPDWVRIGCSVLEMLIALSVHLAFEAEGEVYEWFWHLIENLGLTRYNDARYNSRRIDQIVERLVWRQYSSDGNGGLFPLRNPQDDQRYVEIWFQMSRYVLELS